MINVEIWKDIPGYGNHYQASNTGKIRSKDRVIRKYSAVAGKVVNQKYKGRVLNCKPDCTGYVHVHLGVNKKKFTIQIGRLILMAFVGMPENSEECCHNNGISNDNRLENLRWDTHLENNRDRLRHGTYGLGELHPMAKLNSETVLKIYNDKLPGIAIAEKYGVSAKHVSDIKKGIIWASVTGGKPVETIYAKRSTEKLDPKKAADIRILYSNGVDTAELADRYRVTPSSVRNVITGKTWNNGRQIVDLGSGNSNV
jgi:hypothetical protein